MSKEAKRTYILTSLVCLIPIIAGVFLYSSLPERIATHWDAAGNPNGWSSRFVGVFVLPGSMLLLNLLFPFLLKMDPKYNNISEKIKCLIQWIIPVIALFAGGMTLTAAVGVEMRVDLFAPMFMGLLFIILGNFMPKMAQSYTIGIKVPWTLDSEENWNKTHRFAGRIWVICGLVLLTDTFAGFLPIAGIIAIFVIMIFAPFVYSYLYYLKEKK